MRTICTTLGLTAALLCASVSTASAREQALDKQVQLAWKKNRLGKAVAKPARLSGMQRVTVSLPMRSWMDSAIATVYRKGQSPQAFVKLTVEKELPWEGLSSRRVTWHKLAIKTSPGSRRAK